MKISKLNGRISNNIANVNTTSFKTGRVRFEDMISQTNASAQTGTNAQQVELWRGKLAQSIPSYVWWLIAINR